MSKFNKISSVMGFSCVLFLVGCSSNKNNINNIEIQRRAPDKAMQECKKIEKLNSGSFNEIVLKLQEVMKEYKTCEEKRKALEVFINGKV